MTKIKICGLTRTEDIDFVNEALPDYAGFILHFPKSRRNITVEKAKELKDHLHTNIMSVCVFVDQPLETVIQAAESIKPDVLQLHGQKPGNPRRIWSFWITDTERERLLTGPGRRHLSANSFWPEALRRRTFRRPF